MGLTSSAKVGSGTSVPRGSDAEGAKCDRSGGAASGDAVERVQRLGLGALHIGQFRLLGALGVGPFQHPASGRSSTQRRISVEGCSPNCWASARSSASRSAGIRTV